MNAVDSVAPISLVKDRRASLLIVEKMISAQERARTRARTVEAELVSVLDAFIDIPPNYRTIRTRARTC